MTLDTHTLASPRSAADYITAPLPAMLAILFVLTVVRLIGLKFSTVDLFFDEAQYWSWAQHPEFGYFSKPPLLAWLIAASEHVCGSSEACVRAPAPVIYFCIATIVYFIARRLYDERTAFWSGLAIALATGVVFSARIISTDVPLLLFWSLALLAYVELLERPRWSWTVVLGVAVGLGLLAKYAMVYFYLGVALTALFDSRARALLRTGMFWGSALIALLVLLPNLFWIASHDFVTFKHTGDNIQGNGPGFRPLEGLSFIVSQFGVIGPITFGVFLIGLVKLRGTRFPLADRIMIAFAIPPLALITATAMITHYNANWAATAAISVTIFAIAILVREARWRLIYATVCIGLIAQTLFLVTDAVAPKVSVPFIAKPDVYERTMGWRNLADAVKSRATEANAKSIVADQRAVVAELLYYLRDAGIPIYAWRSQTAPSDQFDMDIPLTRDAPQPVLAVVECPATNRYRATFATVETLPDITAVSGPHSKRAYRAFLLSGASGEKQPAGSCFGS
ncbi:MAG: glycosyltransferase family 39 protein [Xanthobacteraceae bacterium]|nr:glycosyltransferase family 39 protein [Xanthobacteraceae bacterium]